MNKRMLLSVCIGLYTVCVAAQNRSIQFEESKQWNVIVEKALQENKLIFVDCYTDWCGPCKILSGQVFTRDSVADFFNTRFVNAKFEMEKDADGKARHQQWNVKGYPTLLFIDPQTEHVVHRMVGAGKAEWLIAGGQTALNPAGRLNGLLERYTAGEREPAFMITYLRALRTASMHQERTETAIAYLSPLPVEQFAQADHWVIIRENINDPLAEPFQRVMAHRPLFYELEGVSPQEVDERLAEVIFHSVVAVVKSSLSRREFDGERFDRLNEYVTHHVDLPVREQALAWMSAFELSRSNQWNAMLERMSRVEAERIFDREEQDDYFLFFMQLLGQSDQEDALQEGVRRIDRKINDLQAEDAETYRQKLMLHSAASRIYTALGKPQQSADSEKRMLECIAKIQEFLEK